MNVGRSKKRLLLFVAIPNVSIISIAIGVYLYYLLMPAFIQLTVMPFDSKHVPTFSDMAGFTDTDFTQFPSLKQAMQIADNNYDSKDRQTSPDTVYLHNGEARQLAQRLHMAPGGGETFIYYSSENGKLYPRRHILVWNQLEILNAKHAVPNLYRKAN